MLHVDTEHARPSGGRVLQVCQTAQFLNTLPKHAEQRAALDCSQDSTAQTTITVHMSREAKHLCQFVFSATDSGQCLLGLFGVDSGSGGLSGAGEELY